MKHGILGLFKKIYNKYAPKEHHLKNTLLHKILGERIFEPALWKPTKKGIIWAFTLGTFIAFTPTVGGQMIIAGLIAVFFRINIPVSLLTVWISNPLTIIFIYSLEIKIGMSILGNEFGFHKIHSVEEFFQYIIPLSIGGAVLSVSMGIIAYILVNIMFKIGGSIKEHNQIHLPKSVPHIPHPHIPHPHIPHKSNKE